MQIAQALKKARQSFTESDSAQLDAEVLLCHCLECDRSHLHAYPEEELSSSALSNYLELIEKRAAGHPVAHLTNSREFWSLRLQVSPATLIPRPETECLVETALERIPTDQAVDVLDLGTGTGAIAIAIATERPLANIIATDICHEALALAEQNIKAQRLTNINLVEADWLKFHHDGSFDLIVSNPPYIAANDPYLQSGDVRFESRTALVADEDGLADVRIIAKTAFAKLKPTGWLMVEHSYQQREPVQHLFIDYGYSNVKTMQDYAGHDRLTLGQAI